MEKIGVTIELVGNAPWIYIRQINGKPVTERFQANHGFTIGYYPTTSDGDFEFSDTKEVFNLIRKYK
jgi:hypothetical protein